VNVFVTLEDNLPSLMELSNKIKLFLIDGFKVLQNLPHKNNLVLEIKELLRIAGGILL
jgi:hypothetical protein